MARRIVSRTLIHDLVGPPDATVRVACTPPLVIDRHHALFASASLPPLPSAAVFVHIAGKPLSYRTGVRAAAQQSLPGLVTLMPAAVRADIALQGVGEGAMIYFEDERAVPQWLGRTVLREPLTFFDEVIASLARQILEAGLDAGAGGTYLTALGNALLAQLRHVLLNPASAERPRGTRSGLLLAHTAVQHVHRHLDQPLTVQALARACGLGVTHFSNTFRQATGTTPHRYLRRARIERACELLRATSLSIREIAEAVGFRGQSHFCTAFARERGLTPSGYRRGLRRVPE